MSMQTEDMSVFSVLSGMLLQGVNVWSIVGNILIISIVVKTPGLKGLTGTMLLNQAIADILSEILNISVYIDFFVNGENFHKQTILRLGIFVGSGVVAHTLSGLSISLYFAICRPQAFKNMISPIQVKLIICLSWLINIAILSLYYLATDVYVVKPTGDIIMNVTPKNCWFMAVLITNLTILPFCSALVCFVRIYSFTRLPSIATVGAKHVRKLKLAQTIQVTTMVFLLTYIPVFIVVLLGVETKGARAAAAIVNYSYHACKLFIYLKCYKPFRVTCKEMCCLNNRVKPSERPETKPAYQPKSSIQTVAEAVL